MKKLMLWSVAAAVVFVGWTIHREGAHDAFGGTFAFLATAPPEEILDQTFLYADPHPTANQGPGGEPTKRVPITQAVRQRVTASMAKGSQRLEQRAP